MAIRSNPRVLSFRYAFRGIGLMLRDEFNARIHAVATLVVLAGGLACDFGRTDWIAITLAVTIVWCAEAFNTALEALCDAVTMDHRPEIERAKDIAAGAVLLAAIGAIAVALLTFGRHLLPLVHGT
ncbi:MAG TPA: diacylglycerol kinase family protein [Deltaproteobacteria bacterium]|nr:diacylglycerol kinase family protein [Deltaproteobacteria bacterium]